jgi:hypothetical protein
MLESSPMFADSSVLVELKDKPEPEENELEESKSLPVLLNLTDFISCKNAAILSGVTPMVG